MARWSTVARDVKCFGIVTFGAGTNIAPASEVVKLKIDLTSCQNSSWSA
jgi:hypothetical protein